MYLQESIKNRANEFKLLCENHDVNFLYAFGSSVGENFIDDSSDIDLLIDIKTSDPIKRGENLISIWDKLEEFFQRKVDLLTYSSVKNPFLKKSIDTSKILVYEGKELKISF